MCVICYKPKGVNMPSKYDLRCMWDRNHDGAGFVSTRSSYKSMDFDDFYEHLSKVGKDENCVIHFRWATHGSVRLENCHPFSAGDIWFAHNGVLDIRPRKDMTDSETAFRDVIMPYVRENGLYSKRTKAVLDHVASGSRFAILDRGRDRVTLVGSYVRYKGCMCSNMHWRPLDMRRIYDERRIGSQKFYEAIFPY